MRSSILFAAIVLCPCWFASADDWPQWLGPDREGIWKEEGIVDRLPESAPEAKWRIPVGWGYSGPAVSDGKVYLFDYVHKSGKITNNPGTRDRLEGMERITCFSAQDGTKIWSHEYNRPYAISYPKGPRCTPTVADGKVYTLGAEGDLVCRNANDGTAVWNKNLSEEYSVEAPIWGFAAHPLVDGDSLYCVVGGPGSVAVAFDKNTGKEQWRALSADSPGYCPPVMIDAGGVKQLLIWNPETINSLNPSTGEVYWTIPLAPSFGMSIAAPRLEGPYLFASGIQEAAALLKLDDTTPKADVVWRGTGRTALYSCNATPALVDGTIYGCDGPSGTLMGVRLEDGKRLWETAEPTTGERGARNATAFLTQHKDRFFIFSETGDLILANLTPEKYEELGRFRLIEPTNHTGNRDVVWSYPAFAEKCVFARNDKELVCVSLAKE